MSCRLQWLSFLRRYEMILEHNGFFHHMCFWRLLLWANIFPIAIHRLHFLHIIISLQSPPLRVRALVHRRLRWRFLRLRRLHSSWAICVGVAFLRVEHFFRSGSLLLLLRGFFLETLDLSLRFLQLLHWRGDFFRHHHVL